MTWWKSRTNDILGDDPLDALGSALSTVVSIYKSSFGRRPTIAEWEALLTRSMSAAEPGDRCSDEAVPQEVRIISK
jgi:hypothetical protein